MNRLKELRQEKKLSQKELAKELEVHFRTLQNWENEESQIKPDKAQALADYLGVSVGYLLGYEESFEKPFLPEESADFSKAIEIAEKRMVEVLGENAIIFIRNVLNIDEKSTQKDMVEQVNILNAIGILPLEYAEIILRYAILSDDKAEMVRGLLKLSSPKSVPNPEEEALKNFKILRDALK